MLRYTLISAIALGMANNTGRGEITGRASIKNKNAMAFSTLNDVIGHLLQGKEVNKVSVLALGNEMT